MRALFISTLVAVGATSVVPSVGRADEREPLIPFDATAAEVWHLPHFKVGAPRAEVLAEFGRPSEQRGPEFWIYRDFRSHFKSAYEKGYDTLVVIFSGEQVSRMRLVNGAQLTAALAEQQRRLAASALAKG